MRVRSDEFERGIPPRPRLGPHVVRCVLAQRGDESKAQVSVPLGCRVHERSAEVVAARCRARGRLRAPHSIPVEARAALRAPRSALRADVRSDCRRPRPRAGRQRTAGAVRAAGTVRLPGGPRPPSTSPPVQRAPRPDRCDLSPRLPPRDRTGRRTPRAERTPHALRRSASSSSTRSPARTVACRSIRPRRPAVNTST